MIFGRGARAMRLRAADATDTVLGRRDRLTPPRRYLDFVGDSDFRATGQEFLNHFQDLANLKPSDRVLDVGCGIGRMARVLAGELMPPGHYDGFDIVPEAIDWCASHYQNLPVPFTFRHADLFNSRYNPGGTNRAADFTFPYPDESFDLVIATSVFTHLLADGTDNYLANIRRVLAPGGRLFATWFVLDNDGPLPVGAAFDFEHPQPDGAGAVADPAVPEAAVAYRESWLRERLARHGLRLRGSLQYGRWRGTDSGLSFQDILVADRD